MTVLVHHFALAFLLSVLCSKVVAGYSQAFVKNQVMVVSCHGCDGRSENSPQSPAILASAP